MIILIYGTLLVAMQHYVRLCMCARALVLAPTMQILNKHSFFHTFSKWSKMCVRFFIYKTIVRPAFSRWFFSSALQLRVVFLFCVFSLVQPQYFQCFEFTRINFSCSFLCSSPGHGYGYICIGRACFGPSFLSLSLSLFLFSVFHQMKNGNLL